MLSRLAICLLVVWIGSPLSSSRASRVLDSATADNFDLFEYGADDNSEIYDDLQDDFPEEWDSRATRNPFESEKARTDDEYSKPFKPENARNDDEYSKPFKPENSRTVDEYSKDGFLYEAEPKRSSFNVINFGAVGDGRADDTNAFLKAWRAVCGARAQGIPTLIVPKGKLFLLKNVQFVGPCQAGNLNFQIQGNIVAPNYVGALPDKEKWIQFSNVQGLVINGGGHIDGNGAVWWQLCGDKKQSSCVRPTSVHIYKCDGLQLNHLTFVNSPRNHIGIVNTDGARISDLLIRAPDQSPNTDGINILGSTNVTIESSLIGTGDDCIAVSTGSSFITINGIQCGPGHGISIGSLGRDGSFSQVENVEVRNCSFRGTQNGARIKTWQGGSGYARKITFEDITFTDVENPIIIDQHYSDGNSSPWNSNKAVQVSDVTFRNIRGTSADEKAITLECAGRGCRNIVLQDVALKSADPRKKIYADCKNVFGKSVFSTPYVPCLVR